MRISVIALLSSQRKPLEDDALLSDHGIKDDAVLYMTLQQGVSVCVCFIPH